MLKTGLALCVVVALAAACSPDRADDGELSTDGSSASPRSSQCAALLPDGAFTALGWSLESAADEGAGRCERRADGSGAATVMTRAVTETGPEAARDALDHQCDDLRSGDRYVDQPVAWLDPEVEASCFASLAHTRTGVAELYFINSVDEVVQVRVEALAPLEPERVQQAMSAIATASSTLAP